ncbi:MAG: endolytic transglycosylase MltG [Acidobacteriota bacterium]|nr:endolytic transglycosylase MltG [Acidobacteriota bacterium]
MLIVLKKTVKLSLIALILINLWLADYASRAMLALSPAKNGKLTIFIEKGQSAKTIARILKDNQLISRTFDFQLIYSLYYYPNYLKAGEYQFSLPVSLKKIVLDLVLYRPRLHPLTVPAGLTYVEISELMLARNYPFTGSFVQACQETSLVADLDPEARDLEGYLYPETYHFARGARAEEIVKAMVEQFRKNIDQRVLERASQLNFNLRQVITLASLIEKETGQAEEKPLISAVFHNRLRLRMKLDCDPTIIYALKLENKYDGNLRLADKHFNSPYNTYLYPGLPPGPICNPGLDSIQAALYPARVNYLYFVSKNDGSHVFNQSYSEHIKAVKKFQLKNHQPSGNIKNR